MHWVHSEVSSSPCILFVPVLWHFCFRRHSPHCLERKNLWFSLYSAETSRALSVAKALFSRKPAIPEVFMLRLGHLTGKTWSGIKNMSESSISGQALQEQVISPITRVIPEVFVLRSPQTGLQTSEWFTDTKLGTEKGWETGKQAGHGTD